MTGINDALLRYRVLAWIVGTALIVLVCVGVPLQIAGHNTVVKIAGATHGFLFIVYLVAIIDLTRRTGLRLTHMLAIMACGLLPFLTFVAERKTTQWVRSNVSGRAREDSLSAP